MHLDLQKLNNLKISFFLALTGRFFRKLWLKPGGCRGIRSIFSNIFPSKSSPKRFKKIPKSVREQRKQQWASWKSSSFKCYGTNFHFDARLRCYRILGCIASKEGLVILDLNLIFFLHCWYIFLQFSSEKPHFFLVSDFTGNLGQPRSWANLKILMEDFLLIIFNNNI